MNLDRLHYRRARRRARLLAGAAAALACTPVFAAEAPKPAPSSPAPPSRAKTVSEVVVQGEAQKGAVVGDIKPDLTLQPEDVQAYGVSTITELLAELAPQIGSNSGRGGEGPAILVNGRRISGVNEIRNIPTEAILRVDILPEEAALKYGFAANQRVVNIVLKDHVGADLAVLAGGAATEGGGASGQAEVGRTRISGEKRFNIDLKYTPQDSLTEAERNLTSLNTGGPPFAVGGNVGGLGAGGEIDPALSALAGRLVTTAGVPVTAGRALSLADFAAAPPNTTDVRPFRTLVPQSQTVAFNAVGTRPIMADIIATMNLTLEAASSEATRGLPGISLDVPAGSPFSPFGQPVAVDRYVTAFGPLRQDAQGWTGHLGVSLNRDLAGWRLALTGNYDHADNRNENDVGVSAAGLQAAILAGAANPFALPSPALLSSLARDTSRSASDTGNVQLIASGPLWTLPAGPVRGSFRIGGSAARFASDSARAGLVQSDDFSQSQANAQANVDAPLTSRDKKVLGALGDLSLNGHVEVQQVSGFGTLTAVGYGLHWTPIKGLSVIASFQRDEAAPTQQQLNAPLLLTPGSRIFDFATGQTVDVVRVSGGNPALTRDGRDRDSLRITWQPWQDRQLIFRADYNKIHYSSPIATFPAASADIEAAFPDRFVRDATGRLTEVDFRPVNFASQDVQTLRWGFDYSRPIGPPRAPAPRNQAVQDLRRAGLAGQVGRRAGLPPPGAVPGALPPTDAAVPPPAADGAPPAPGGGFPGGGGRGFAGGPGGFGGGRGGGPAGGALRDGRLHISVFHTVYFTDRFLVRPTGPVIDFLDGASLGSGGRPQHEIEAQINLAERGFGGELQADWKSGTRVIGAARGGDLGFSGLLKVNARLFADLTQRKTLVSQHPWLRGVRVSLAVQNLFDERMKVVDSTGVTPLNFQPAYLDPLGRTYRIELRKLFATGV